MLCDRDLETLIVPLLISNSYLSYCNHSGQKFGLKWFPMKIDPPANNIFKSFVWNEKRTASQQHIIKRDDLSISFLKHSRLRSIFRCQPQCTKPCLFYMTLNKYAHIHILHSPKRVRGCIIEIWMRATGSMKHKINTYGTENEKDV